MLHFIHATSSERTGLRGHWHRAAAGQSASQQRYVARKDLGMAKEALFRAQDSGGVVRLLADKKANNLGPATNAGDELASALADLRTALDSPILRVGQIVEQMIDVWALATNVDPAAAKPVEALLWAMEGCDLVTAGQVRATCDQVEAVLRSPAVPAVS